MALEVRRITFIKGINVPIFETRVISYEKKPVREGNISEKHVTYILTIPVAETFTVLTKSDTQDEDIPSYVEDGTINIFSLQSLALLVTILAIAVGIFLLSSYRPPIDSYPIDKGIHSCPEKRRLEDIQISLNQCHVQSKKARSDFDDCSNERTKQGEQFDKLSGEYYAVSKRFEQEQQKASTLEGDLKKAKEEVVKRMESMKELEEKVLNLSKERDEITKKFQDTEYKLGACRNKNMEHEVSNSELLQELDEVKKELAKC